MMKVPRIRVCVIRSTSSKRVPGVAVQAQSALSCRIPDHDQEDCPDSLNAKPAARAAGTYTRAHHFPHCLG